MLVTSLDPDFWAMKVLILAELAVTCNTPLAVLAGAGVELWKLETDSVELIARVVLACAESLGIDDMIGVPDPQAGV